MTKGLLLFGDEYEDGGESYYIEVELMYGDFCFYRCHIHSIPASFLQVDQSRQIQPEPLKFFQIEYYEIATYGGLTQLAATLGRDVIAKILGQIISEKNEADES